MNQPGAALDDTLRAALLGLPVATLSAVLYARGLRSRFLHGVVAVGAPKMVGLAHTVRAIPVREDVRTEVEARRAPSLHRLALDAAWPGDVVVFATEGAARVSVLGDIIATALAARGVAGFVTDTGVADLVTVAGIGWPVFAAGGSAPVPSSALVMVADHGRPIGIAGVAVFPGDVMVGDVNGVVCIPRAIVAEVAAAAAEKEAMEGWILQQVAAGAPLEGTYPPSAEALARYRAARPS